MNTIQTSQHICGCCKRELPREAFYMNRRTRAADNYCKECRKADTRKRRDQSKNILFENKPLSYPVITEVKDSALRMFLILRARQVVADSIRRKQEKDKLRALWEE
ncbi:hypothetical protein [uncultured Bacteroides sp.]|uniref:hypothetical protein n=1 Tax=uncultured Bacteroides sp. TaxID=162156 RepID=UPI0025E81B09|nr:hypothetical protein [uncultured Bacteroides sp.]